jgi:uracil-DNA glycosylase
MTANLMRIVELAASICLCGAGVGQGAEMSDAEFGAAAHQYANEVRRSYCAAVKLPSDYHFATGEPVLPLPPAEIRRGGIFIIGAYPSAVFKSIKGRIVPVENLKMPFDVSEYPGGTNKSAKELDDNYLTPLGLTRRDCWITNLVKAFLFKKEHAAQFAVLGSAGPMAPTRERFEEYAAASLPWIEQELRIAEPRLIITLGAEVAGVVEGVRGDNRRLELLDYKVHSVRLVGREYAVVHMVHPGQLMRKHPKWIRIHQDGIKALRPFIQQLLSGGQ